MLSISAASATLAISMLFASVGARIGFCEEPFIPYQVTEDVVYGHKDGLALTLDVLEPTEKPNHIGLILISSGSWNSRKSDVRANAARFGINPDQIGITSGSSGGHLALMAATQGDDGKQDSKDPIERISSRTHAVVAWFPPTDFINWMGPNSWPGVMDQYPEIWTWFKTHLQ